MTDQNMLRDIFGQHTEVRDVRIIKGNTQGQFDRYCYAFITVKGTQEQAQSIINKVSIDHPNWKMNIKQDNQTRMMNNNTPYQMRQPPNRNFNQMYIPQEMNMMMRQPQQQPYSNQSSYIQQSNPYPPSSSQNTSQKIIGEKIYKIFVREIWLGGIPQMCDQNYMATLMSQFGTVDNMQIFPKFAFVRFKMAQQATNAYQRATRIYNMFGQPSGFRITFSDPSRRAQIVSNHYDYDRLSVFIPVLFLGFPPVTSATVQLDHMRSICQKYGTIVNYYMRKNNNNQTRSYILFTYDSLKTALRAKQQLSRRRDLLGDKRVEVTLLLNENELMKGRDLSETQRSFPDPGTTSTKTVTYDKSKKNPTMMFPNQQMIYQQPGNYPPSYQSGYYQPTYPGMYYPPQSYDKKGQHHDDRGHEWNMPQQWDKYDKKRQGQWDRPIQSMQPPRQQYGGQKYYPKHQEDDVFNLVQEVLDKGSRSPVQDEPKIKKPTNNQYTDPSQIISKMLGTQKKPDQGYSFYEQRRQELVQGTQGDKEKDPAWSGILTWKGTKKANIDGHFSTQTEQECEFQDYNVNIFFGISPIEMVLKEKLFRLILEPMNSMSGQAFQQYLLLLKDKVGVSITNQYVIYVMGKCKQADQICKIDQNQLLMVMEKKSEVYPLIKDKLTQI